MNCRGILLIACIALVGGGLLNAGSAYAATVEWIRQYGSSQYELSGVVAVDGLGGVYVAGSTRGLLGEAAAGDYDGVLNKYDNSGNLLWTRQFGTPGDDGAYGVAADALGNVFVTGHTQGNLGGQFAGGYDWYVMLFDEAGGLKWTRQGGGEHYDGSTQPAVDGQGNVVVGGITGRVYTNSEGLGACFVSKYDNAGNLIWTNSLTTGKNDGSRATSVDGLGNVYVAGFTTGDLGGVNAGGSDAYLAKYSAEGSLQWIRQFGSTEEDQCFDIHADAMGNVYVTGITSGELAGQNAGLNDAFLAKYDAAGDLAWIQQWGAKLFDSGMSVDTDLLGGVYVSGDTWGDVFDAGGGDAYIKKFDASGGDEWTREFGSYSDEIATVAADKLGNVFLAGDTSGIVGERNFGEADFFLIRMSDVVVPEPDAVMLIVGGAVTIGALQLPSRRRFLL